MRTAGFCPPLMRNQAHAGHLRYFLREVGIGEILDLGQRQSVGSQCQRENRRIGRDCTLL